MTMEASLADTRLVQSLRTGRARFASAAFTYVAMLGLGITFSFPFLWTISSSLKTAQEVHVLPPLLLPAVAQWHNYVEIFVTQPLARWLVNSTTIIAFALPGALLTASLVAYSFARFSYPGRDFWFMVLLSTMILPTEVTLIPQYLLYHAIGWLDTYAPLIIPAWAGGGAFTIFLLRQFFLTIPRDLDEAAMVDGANSLQILWHVIVPLSGPALATAAIIQFLVQWNEFLSPMIYLSKVELFTMAVGLNYFLTLHDKLSRPTEHLLMAASIVMTLPAIVLFFAAQRYFIRGIVMSGLRL
jgi:multiple sugar transport system permease protein